jgi:hypothetical protein
MGNVFYRRIDIALGGAAEGNMKHRVVNVYDGKLKLVGR